VAVAALNLIDLAGSESADVHGPASTASRSREMRFINRVIIIQSLLTLGTVIMRLSAKKNNAPIPYRDSKLTRLLQPALEGDSKVSIVCNISPSSDAYDETLSTLKFAQRAKKIKQTITKNEVQGNRSLILKYQQEIQQLQDRLKEMENRLANEENATLSLTLNSQLIMLQEEKEKADARLESILQEKLQLANDLEKLKSFIICAEDIKPGKSLFGRNKNNFLHSFTFKQRRFSSLGTPEKLTQDSFEVARKGERRDSFLLKGIENIELELEGSEKPSLEECLRIIKEQAKLIESYENMTKDQVEQENVEELKKMLEEKDDEIEQLKDELQLCRNNLTRLQMSNRLKRFESP
jgi:centromeric protein E